MTMNTDLEHGLRRIEELHQMDKAAWNARDKAKLLSLCTDDCVMLAPGEDPIVGRDVIRASLEQDVDKEQCCHITECIRRSEEVQVVGGWAFEWGRFSAAAEPLGGGRGIRTSGKMLRILRQQPDRVWKVARAI